MASLWAGVSQALQTLGGAIAAATATTKRRRLLITGLRDAGKTTLLYRMRNPDPAPSRSPTFFPASGSDIRLDVDVGVTNPYSSGSRNHYNSSGSSSNSDGRNTGTRVHLVLDAVDLGGAKGPAGVSRSRRGDEGE